MAKNNASIQNIEPLIAMGLDPKTGLPLKFGEADCKLKENIKKNLRILDEQDAINRYKWFNLPSGLDGQLLERILYYKGQAMFFYDEYSNNFYFLPYALSGTIDIYGRFKRVQGLPFNGTNETKGIEAFTRDVVLNLDEVGPEAVTDGCVLLHDYSKQISQTNISRQILQDPILDAMAEAFPFARTSMIANSGIKGMRVNSQDEAYQVKAASRSMTRAALEGDPMIPIVAQVEFQDLTSAGTPLKCEEYLEYLQSLDNFRLSFYGLKQGGLFQKKSHMLESEQQMNDGNTLLAYQDGLTIRQRFCDYVNSIWGLGIWCEPSECVTAMDANLDGFIGDEQDQTGTPGEQDVMEGVFDNE